jgi:PKD repeat protein
MRKALVWVFVFFGVLISADAQIVCSDSDNLIIYSNYDGGIVTINVDLNIPNIKLGICTYEPVQVTITGPFVANVTQVVYAGFNSMQNNNNCNQGNFVTSISGVSASIVQIETYPPIGYTNPNGHPNMVGTGGACDTTQDAGGGNTPDEIVYYFQQATGGYLRSHFTQYQCWQNDSYNVSAGGNCCILPSIAGQPVSSFTADNTEICTGNCINFTNTSSGGPFTEFEWSFPGSDTPVSSDENPSNICYNTPGTYEVELTVISASGENTRSTDNFITVGGGEIPVIALSYPSTICQSGGTVSPTINPENTPGGLFTSSSGLSLNSATGEIDVSQSLSGQYTITYTVENLSCGSTEPSSSSYSVSIDSVSTISVVPSNSVTVCEGETVQLTAESGFSNYVWSTNETGNSISVSESGSYAVSAQNQNNCAGISDTVRVAVISPPVASFTYAQQEGYVVDFTNTSQGATSYLWNFGSGFTSTESDPSYNFLFDNTWPVSLIVENECGTDTIELDVIVIKVSGIGETTSIAFSVRQQAGGILISPTDQLTEEVEIRLLTVSGKLVYAQSQKMAGKHPFIVPTPTLASGVYILQLQSKYGIGQQKLFLEH